MTANTPQVGAIPEWDKADRMRKAMRMAKLESNQMADYLGVSRATVSAWINGRSNPSSPALKLFAMRCGVSYDWLIGMGPGARTPGFCRPGFDRLVAA